MKIKPRIGYVLVPWLMIACHQGNINIPIEKKIYKNKSYPAYINVSKNIPLGCPLIKKLKEHDEWSVPLDDDPFPNATVQRNDFKRIEKCFYLLNNVKSIKPPKFSRIEYIQLAGDSVECRDETHFSTDFKYRLPDIEGFNCYYQYGSFFFNKKSIPDSLRDAKHDCQEYGNLVLVDKISGLAMILNLYFSYGNNTDTYKRRFYINPDWSIDIFEIAELENKTVINKRYKINMSHAGYLKTKR